MTCVSGKCGFPPPAPVPTGQPCDADTDTCADDAASCTEYQTGTPNGTYCLLPDASACTAAGECESDACTAGVCVTSCTVCASGCPYTTIPDAMIGVGPGGTIHIAPGVYDSYGNVNAAEVDNLTLRRCGARGEVRWTSTSDLYCFHIDGAYAATLENLTFFGTNSEPGYNLITMSGDSSGPTFATLTVNNCVFENMAGGDSYGSIQLDSYSNITFTGCTFRNNTGYSDGGAIQCSGGDSPVASRNNLTLTDCTFVQNQAGGDPGLPDSYGGALYLYRTNATITGCTFDGNYGEGGGAITAEHSVSVTITDTVITGNRSTSNGSPYPGGGILLVPAGSTADVSIDLTLAGTTKISQNVGSQGSGIAVQAGDPSYLWTVTGAEGKVKNNTGAPDQCAVSTDGGTTWTGVTNCAF
jgi:predicted outer membrane repeat protein